MFNLTESEAWQQHCDGSLSLSQYLAVRDSIKAQEQSQAEAVLREETAKKVEEAIVGFGGMRVPRGFGEIPNPLKNKHLTNEMAIVRAAKSGNPEAVQLIKFLSQESGTVAPDYVREIQEAQLNRAREADRLRTRTTELMAANDRLMGRDRHEAFPSANAEMRARSAGTTPYIPPRGA